MMPINAELSAVTIHNALLHDEFILYYQPQFDLKAGTFTGVEALIRWQHPTLGFILPDKFLTLAASNDLMIQIDEWVLRRSAKEVLGWIARGVKPLRLAVNVTEKQLRYEPFVQQVEIILNETKFPSEHLELELSENLIINEQDDELVATINQLRKKGIQISLDDFGKVHADISYLQKIACDRIKIDKHFLHQNKMAAVHTFINLAKNLDLIVIVEGVESIEHLENLQEFGCDELQGDFFSPAIPGKEMENFLMHYQNNPFINKHKK